MLKENYEMLPFRAQPRQMETVSRRKASWSRAADVSERALVTLLVFTSPMNFLRLNVFYFTFSDALTLICLLLMLARRKLSLQPMGPACTFFWFLGLSMLLGGLLISSILYGDPIRGLIYTGQYFFAYFILPLVILGRPWKEVIFLIKVYVLSIFLMCLHGAYLINVDGEKNTAFVSGSGRLTGFVERENECAALIGLCIPLFLSLWKERKLPRLALLALPVFGYAVMLTGSNSGLVTLALALAIFGLLGFDWKYWIPAVGLGAATIATVDLFGRDYLPAVFQRRVLGALETGDIDQAGTFDHRMGLIYEAIGRANETVFLGLGADQYAVTSFVSQPVHNVYLLLWTEGGLGCMIGFIIMIAAAYGPALAAFRRNGGGTVAACLITVVTLFALMVNAFPSVYGRFWPMPILLAIALARGFVTDDQFRRLPPLRFRRNAYAAIPAVRRQAEP